MPHPIWFGYALETNTRGRALADRIQSGLPASACRSLDVGCGFGGLIRSLASLGLEAVGIELDPERVVLAEANCLDSGGQASVYRGDILDNSFVCSLGRFDLITCTDVIEHVLNPQLALRNMVSILNPGGVLYLEIPNKYSLRFVNRDGHFNLFGITLLPRRQAIQYHSRFFEFNYDVGYYLPRQFYIHYLKRLGCTLRLDSPPFQPVRPDEEIPFLLEELRAGYSMFRRSSAKKLPAGLKNRIVLKYWAFLVRFFIDLVLFELSKGNGFRQEYLMDFWEITASKRQR